VAYIRDFGAYLPERVVSNAEMGERAGCDADWIFNVSGIQERRFAAAEQTVVDLAVHAAEDCLQRSGAVAADLGMIFVATGSAERRFPGPAAQVASRLGLDQIPALDLPMASAGSLFGLSLASQIIDTYGHILVIGAEKMSSVALREPMERGIAILFGDGAGACLVSRDEGKAKILDSILQSGGAYAEDLRLEFNEPMVMNGRSVILQASRKIPRVIGELLARNGKAPSSIEAFLMHQANQNLIVRVAQALDVQPERFYSNIVRYGNTSSASMLIASKEWAAEHGFKPKVPVCFAAFGAGFHWGALLAEGV
jgi:3-oxoacyl-[acyl-carrier-protein] synthase-3